MKRFNTLIVALLLTGCSSPPEPPEVDWQQPAAAVNTTLPDWQESTGVIPSPAVSGHWNKYVIFTDENQTWTPDIWYAVAHSPVIYIRTFSTENYFRAKAWLLKHGVTGVVAYKNGSDCLTCTTRIYFSR